MLLGLNLGASLLIFVVWILLCVFRDPQA